MILCYEVCFLRDRNNKQNILMAQTKLLALIKLLVWIPKSVDRVVQNIYIQASLESVS